MASAHLTEVNAKVALDNVMDVGPAKSDSDPLQDDYRVRLTNFEGPLDLLLHLIRKDQLNIYDIPIAHICQAYSKHLDMMKDFDVNVAGEFMLMAATLTYMKSLILLPRDETAAPEDDPRLPLVAQLLEYEKFKKAADKIDQVPWLYRDIYPRPATAANDIAIPIEALLDGPIEAIDTFQLLLCLKASINRTTRPPLQISTDPTSIKDKVLALTTLLETSEIVDFTSLLPEIPRVRDVIVSFLAVLELAKLKFIEIIQYEALGKIQIRATRPLAELNAGLLDQY